MNITINKNIKYRIKQEYNHFKIMNPFTALKNLSPFHFTSLFLWLILSTLLFNLLCYSYLQLTSLNFTSLHFLSPSHPLTGFHFPNPRFENKHFTVGSPCCPFRSLVPSSNGPIHKGVFSRCPFYKEGLYIKLIKITVFLFNMVFKLVISWKNLSKICK